MKTTKSKTISPLEILLNACKVQEETISNLLSVIGEKGTKAVEYVKRAYTKHKHKQVETPVKVSTDKKTKRNSNSDLFLEALRKIGHPATSWEISKVLKNMNTHFKKLSKNKKSFMQVVYSSASFLTKENMIKRVPLAGGNSEYALKEWVSVPQAKIIHSVPQTESREPHKKTNTDYFLEVMTKIGHPVTASEIASRLRKTNPYFKKLSVNKKGFMQLVYSSISNLNKEGILERKPIGGKSYEYSVKIAA